MSNKNIIFNLTLEQYNKKYRNRKHRLLKFSKKEVEDFNKKNLYLGNNFLLKDRKWALIKDTYYEIPKPIRFTWFRNLNVSCQVATCLLTVGVVAAAITVPVVLLNQNNVSDDAIIDPTKESDAEIKVEKKTNEGTIYKVSAKDTSKKKITGIQSVYIGNDELKKTEEYIVDIKGESAELTIKKVAFDNHKGTVKVNPIVESKEEPIREVTKEQWVLAADDLYESFCDATTVYDKTDVSNVQIGDVTSETSEITDVEYRTGIFGERSFKINFSSTGAYFARKPESSGQGLKDFLSSETEGGHFIINRDGSLEYRTDTIPSGKVKWYREIKINPYDYVTFMDEVRFGTTDFIYKATYNGAPHPQEPKSIDLRYDIFTGGTLIDGPNAATEGGDDIVFKINSTLAPFDSEIAMEAQAGEVYETEMNIRTGENTITFPNDQIQWDSIENGETVEITVNGPEIKEISIDYNPCEGITVSSGQPTTITERGDDLVFEVTSTLSQYDATITITDDDEGAEIYNEVITIPNGTSNITLDNGDIDWNLVDVELNYTVNINAPSIIHVTDVSLDKTNAVINSTFMTGPESLKLNPTVSPNDATDKSVTWDSSDKNVAIVDSEGNITAINPGSSTITVKTNDQSKTATCDVTVTNIDFNNSEISDPGTTNIVITPSELSEENLINKETIKWSIQKEMGEDKTVFVGNDGSMSASITIPEGTSQTGEVYAVFSDIYGIEHRLSGSYTYDVV